MSWQWTEDVEEFRRVADPYLAADAARNTVLLTVSESLRGGDGGDGGDGVGDGDGGAADADPPGAGDGPARFGWWREDGPDTLDPDTPDPDTPGAPVSGAFLQTPPYPPYLGTMPARAAVALAHALRAGELGQRGAALTEVRGRAADIGAFGAAWADGTGPSAGDRAAGPSPYRLTHHIRLFRLGELTPQSPAPEGRARPARAEDVPLVAAWLTAFADEIGEPAGADQSGPARARIGQGLLLLWEKDGVPVSLAGRSPLLADQIRIAPVYTPPAHRGRGYAAGVTAAISEAARRAGAREVLLFADNANPTSTALYQRLGYRPIEGYATLELDGGT
ncbi:GNAT family N-acetyltransferase [Streptomyces sp. NPDC093085]|uniref:GNAT family N-acetyltransferase n=1 Tax=Streptomyces sp. NPDC093085 TaxID=3155068 RepID=UPI003432CD8E